jgi:hypothetical protein
MINENSFLRNVEEEGAFMDKSVPIDEAIAAHAARTGPPAPLASAGGIDPPEDEPPSLRKRGGVYGSHSVSSTDPSQRSAYEGSSHPGSAYMERGSPYQDSAFQDGSAYDDDVEPHNTYYRKVGDDYGGEYRREAQYQPDDEYDRQDQYQPDDEYDRQEEYQPDDEYDRHNKYQPDDEYDRHGYQPSDEYYDEGGNHVDGGSYDITPQPSEEQFSPVQSEVFEGSPIRKEPLTSPTSGSEFSMPTVSEGEFVGGSPDISPSNSNEYSNPPPETTRRSNTTYFPPISPRSAQGSEYSQSTAMRGAQELLRRNRQKRLELAQKMKRPLGQFDGLTAPGDEVQDPDVISPQSHDSGSTWQTNGGSEYTGSEVTGGSSIWTEGENNPDRSSRRALILQMARARMKSHGKPEPSVPVEEKKREHAREAATDIDLTGDLD